MFSSAPPFGAGRRRIDGTAIEHSLTVTTLIVLKAIVPYPRVERRPHPPSHGHDVDFEPRIADRGAAVVEYLMAKSTSTSRTSLSPRQRRCDFHVA